MKQHEGRRNWTKAETATWGVGSVAVGVAAVVGGVATSVPAAVGYMTYGAVSTVLVGLGATGTVVKGKQVLKEGDQSHEGTFPQPHEDASMSDCYRQDTMANH
jgi:hypothetical protein